MKRQADEDSRIRNSILRFQQQQVSKARATDLRAERQARREDWDMGKLAPKRDVGLVADSYGAIDMRYAQGVDLPEHKRPKVTDVREGDRVVILEGVDQGKIGTVKEVRKSKGDVVVDGLNLVSFGLS
jgi:large subunit ribosomal protein L24